MTAPEVVRREHPELAEVLAARLEAEARAALAARGRFALALSGGSVAEVFYPPLAGLALDWGRCDFFYADERAVPPSHPDSNHGLARRLWLEPAGVPAGRVHRMPADATDLAVAASAYAATLEAALGRPPRLDVTLLGTGPDGHVASLFPGHVLLAERTRTVAAIADSPKPPPRRLTLTLPVLAGARLTVVAALGEAKAEAVRDALGRPESDTPLARLLHEAPRALVLLDPGAASLLDRP